MSVPRSLASRATAPPQLLDGLLSHYHEGVKPTVRSHLSCLLQEFPGLHVKLEAFAQSDGSPPCLFLRVGGTIPISFLQVIYNIPVAIWLSADYPSRAPLVFVTPSPSMIIQTGHPLVDPSGLVSCPLLRSWVSPPSNLVYLMRSLCLSFGHDPPLYSVMHPPHAHDAKLRLSSQMPSSSSSSSPSASPSSSSVSLLGPCLSSQRHPLHSSVSPPMPSASMSSSLLGPGSLSPRLPSHAYGREPSVAHLPQPQPSATAASSHHYFSHASSPNSSTARASSSLTSAGSPAPALSQQHPSHLYGTGVSMVQISSPTSALTSASLLGPGKLSQGPMVIPFSTPQLRTEMLNCPILLTQGHSSPAFNVHLPMANHPSPSISSSTLTSTSTSASLLGPGKVSQTGPLHVAKHTSSGHLSVPAASASLIGLGSLGQCHPLHSYVDGSLGQWHHLHTHADGSSVQQNSLHTLGAGVSVVSSPTTSTSASLLGGSLSHQHALHAHKGVSRVQLSQSSRSAPASLFSETPSQQHPTVNYTYGLGEELNTSTGHVHNTGADSSSSASISSSNPMLSISMPQNAGPPSSLQQHFTLPAQCVQYLNPIFDSTDLPSDSRQSVIDMLIGRLQCDVDKIRKDKEMDMLKFMDIEGLLTQRQRLCEKGVQELQQQKENLELQLQTLLVNTDLLETWLVANNKSDVNIDIDEIFEPYDGHSNQLRECVALDLAIEDALYCLGKAAEEGQIPVDSYLRYVKTLSREQFFHRAIANKVRAAQGQ